MQFNPKGLHTEKVLFRSHQSHIYSPQQESLIKLRQSTPGGALSLLGRDGQQSFGSIVQLRSFPNVCNFERCGIGTEGRLLQDFTYRLGRSFSALNCFLDSIVQPAQHARLGNETNSF